MLARGLIISRRFVQVRTAPKHRSTHISNYQSSKHETNQHDESDMMKFPCTLKNALLIIRDRFGLSFASKGLGYLAALLLLLSLLTRYKLHCYQTTLLLTISALADITLLKTTCHFLLLLVGFDTLTYRKGYDRSHILVGHQVSMHLIFHHFLVLSVMFMCLHPIGM